MANDENPQSVTVDTVGFQLKKARESKGLTATDVADAQHLRTGIIHSIESAEYEQIGSELFLKGYVRAYAVHVGLDADAVIADLDRELEPLRQKQAQELEASPLVDIERRRRKKRQIARILIPTTVLVIVGILLFTFVFSEDESVVAPVSEEQSGVMAPGDSDESAVEGETLLVPGTEDDASAEPEPGLTPDSNAGIPVPAEDSPEEGALASEPELPDEVVQVPAADAPVSVPVEAETPAPVASDAGRVQISFVDDCWIRITDAQGKRLVNSLKRSGDQVDVAGEAPLKVVIGAVNAVDSIRFQGLPVDMAGFTVVNNRSEFTLAN